MRSFFRSLPTLALLASATYVLAAEPALAPPNARPLPPAQHARVVEGYGKLPLSFEPNRGQTDPKVKFLSRGDGYSLFLTSSEAVLSLRGKTCSQPSTTRATVRPMEKSQPCAASPDSVVRMSLLGSNHDAHVDGQDALPGKSNYFVGNNPSAWYTNISNYRKVQYRDVYPGIDLVYYGNQRRLEHDFILAPGADPNAIRLSFTGTESVKLNRSGDLVLFVKGDSVTLKHPVVYQNINGKKKLVIGNYTSKGTGEIGFAIGRFDRTKELIVDPVLVYSTYFGGKLGGDPSAIAVDSEGNAYVAGTTESTDFPVVNALFKKGPGGFISKLSADGSTLLYSTFLGSNLDIQPQAIAVDKEGNAYVSGITTSPNFPVVNPLQPIRGGIQNAFILKISFDGSKLIYSTYLGGEYADNRGLAIDGLGSAYVTGFAGSGFPLVHPLFTKGTVYVAKLTPSGMALDYSTYLGGSFGESGNAIAVDAAGEAVVTGVTESPDFPVSNALFPACILQNPQTTQFACSDIFATKLNASGTGLVYSTFLGVGQGNSIASNAAGDAFITGTAAPNTFPVANALYPTSDITDAFVMRLNANGSALVYSTYLGHSEYTQAASVAIDSADNAYVSGTAAAGFPLVFPLQPVRQPKPQVDADVFLAKIHSDGSALDFSTYLGGTGLDQGFRVAVDSEANAYLTGNTFSRDFTIKNAFQPKPPPVHSGFDDATGFIAKISDLSTHFSIANTVDHTTVSPGGDLHYTITVTNIGPGSAFGVVSVTSVRDRFRNCTVNNGDPCEFVLLGGRATVQLSLLAQGEDRTIMIYATAAKTAGDYNLVPLAATINSVPPQNETHFASVTTTVRETADISIASSLVDSTNGLLHYVHTVTNLGPDNAHAVLLLDPLPANTTYVSASTTAGKCSFHPTIGAHGAVRCPLNNPNSGTSMQVDVVLQATSASGQSISNATSVTSQSIDLNSANDASTVVTQLP